MINSRKVNVILADIAMTHSATKCRQHETKFKGHRGMGAKKQTQMQTQSEVIDKKKNCQTQFIRPTNTKKTQKDKNTI